LARRNRISTVRRLRAAAALAKPGGFVLPVAERVCLCGSCFTNDKVTQNRELASNQS
jgi:hypothetical protein